MVLRGLTAAVLGSLLAVPAAGAVERLAVKMAGGDTSLELFIADANGEHERSLTAPSGHDYNASFSIDGQWILFTSERAGSADIYRVHPDGSGLARLTSDPSFEDQASLSPDGKTLAFVSTREGGTANIWLMDLRSHAMSNLTKSASGNFRPSWSPDGKWVAFSSDRDTGAGRLEHQWELLQATAIYIVHPDGTGLRRLTPLSEAAGSPKWSLDGRSLVFYLAAKPYGRTRIVTLDIAAGVSRPAMEEAPVPPELTGQVRTLSPQYTAAGVNYLAQEAYEKRRIVSASGARGPLGDIQNPAWSPDGKSVVYQKSTPRDHGFLEKLVSRDGRYELLLNTVGPFASLSVNGEGIVYGDNSKKIMVAKANGAEARAIVSVPGVSAYTPFSLSGDEKLVAFGMGPVFHKEGVSQQIAIVSTDGSNLRTVTSAEGSNNFPSFSPDGGRIVYRVFGPEQGLRILSLKDGSIAKLTDAWDNFPAWSPKADVIAFTRFDGKSFDIYTVRSDGSDLKRLTDDHGNDAHARWSPDGRWLSFVSSRLGWRDEAILPGHGGQSYGELYVMRADGSGLIRLTDNQWEEGPAVWLHAPSGRH
jgi:Tol biopolymer transport system component